MANPVVVRRSHRADRGDVVWLRFTTGLERNRMTRATIDGLAAAVTELADDGNVGLVVLGSGEGDFSAGADPEVLAGRSEGGYIQAEYDLFLSVEALPSVTVAAVDGYCLGNAAELSLSCDFRVGGPRLKWGYPEARLGLMAPASRLLRQVPRGVATRLALGGAWLDTAEAVDAGLVEAVVDDVSSEAQVLAAVDRLARATPAGARWTKQAIRDAWAGRDREVELAAASLAEAVSDEDA